MTERSAQILIAGVGNTFMRDDGFGAEVVRVLKEREPEPGVTIEDFRLDNVRARFKRTGDLFAPLVKQGGRVDLRRFF